MLFKKHILASAVIAVLISGCTGSPAIVVKAGSGEQTLTAKAGKNFTINLEAQLSTGYSWKVMEMPESLTLVKENVIADEKTVQITGGYEIQEFIFKASKTGGVVIFKYGEHWKKKPDYVNTSKITIEVE